MVNISNNPEPMTTCRLTMDALPMRLVSDRAFGRRTTSVTKPRTICATNNARVVRFVRLKPGIERNLPML